MTALPKLLRISPYLFYAGAVLFGVYHFLGYLPYMDEISEIVGSESDAFAKMQFVLQSRPFVLGLQEGAYVAANGAIIHVLIAIYDKLKGLGE